MTNQPMFKPISHITVQDFAKRLNDQESPLQLIDVREPQEIELACLDGFTVFPLSQFAKWSPQISNVLDPEIETVVMCHHGMRSAQMCGWLIEQGFLNVKNLEGGIDAYAVFVDNRIPRY